jgi:predicted nucleic acid-binding protein
MNVVVADTGPLQYLNLCGVIEILPRLFESVLIPFAVLHELQADATPLVVRAWSEALPAWIKVQASPPRVLPVPLDAGERDAIALALSLEGSILLIDEAPGRSAALQLGIPIIGTIGIIERAALQNLLDIEKTVALLRQTNIFLSENLIQSALERVRRARR